MYVAIFGITLALAWRVAVHEPQLAQLRAQDYDLQRCDVVSSNSSVPLRILDAVYMEVLQLLEYWCKSQAVGRHFGSVELRSVHREHLDLRELYESRYDMVIAKPELMINAGRALPGGLGYEQIAKYPSYGSQLVSLSGVPQLSVEGLSGVRFGLLDDPNSVSAYQIPMAALRKAGLEDVPEIVYFRSFRQMYRAFYSREVDVIPALLYKEGPDSELQLPPGLVLEQAIAGPAWYLRSDLVSTPRHCVLQAELLALSEGANVDFLRGLQFTGGCEDAAPVADAVHGEKAAP